MTWPRTADEAPGDDVVLKPLMAGGGAFGVIYNPMSYRTTPIPGSVRRTFLGWKLAPNYEFRNGNPGYRGQLTYWHPDGFYVRPDHRFVIDFNTYPGPVEAVMPRDRYAIPSIFHDSVCEKHDGKHHGRWLARRVEGPWDFEVCSSVAAARDFGLMMRCCGAWAATANGFEWFVRRCGPQF